MTIQKQLYIIPEYDERTGCFLGYAVKKGNIYLKNAKGEKIILLGNLNTNGHYDISYQEYSWSLSADEHEHNTEALLKFEPKTINSVFQGYTIYQFDEKEQKIVSRGTISAIDVKYKRAKNGNIDCIYEDKPIDSACQSYFIQQITQEEYDLRIK